jgi:hypothetical protein
MMKPMLFAAFALAMTVPAAAQTGKVVNGLAVTFECVSDASRKDIAILVTNPNGVDKKCSMKCTYTSADKKSYYLECSGVGVFKDAKKLRACSEGSPKGGAPFTSLKATGSCT